MSHNDQFRLFVYGTLKRGYWNHEAYCESAVSVEEATVRGRLYELPPGIPLLEVPDGDILAVGTDDLVADMRVQESVGAPSVSRDLPGWYTVHGEIVTFDDATLRIPPIDRLESFRPGRFSLYIRVLVSVSTASEDPVTAWCYIASPQALHTATPIRECRWPQ